MKKIPRQLGIHLTEHSVRVIESANNGQTVTNFGRSNLPRTFTEMRKDSKDDELAGAIMNAINNTKPKRTHVKEAVITFGDEGVFTKILTMPQMPLNDAKEAAPHELEPDLPLKAENMYVDLFILHTSKDQKEMEVMVFATNKRFVDWILGAVDKVGLNTRALETTSISLGRLHKADHNNYVTVDIGSTHAAIAVFDKDLIHVLNTVALQDKNWDAFLAKDELNITAEQIKQNFNVMLTNLSDRVAASIKYYKNKNHQTDSIEKIFLSGSGARVPHLDTILAEYFNEIVEIGQPKINSQEQAGCDSSYLAALGASLRNFDE